MSTVKAMLAVSLLASGCSAFLDVDGLSKSGCKDCEAADPTDERTSDGGARASTSRGTDSGGPDPGTSLGDDGGPQKDPPPMVGPTTWCSTQTTTFCDDFDRAPLPSAFAAQEGGFLSLGTTKRQSAPNALVVNVPTSAGTDISVGKLVKSFNQASNDTTLAFDISPDKVNSEAADRAMLVWAIDYPITGGGRYSIRLVFVFQRVRLEESTPGLTDVYHPLFDLPLVTWTRFSVDLKFSGTTGSYVHRHNGSQVATAALRVPAGLDPKPTLMLGAVYGPNPQNGWKFLFDNVMFDLR